MDGRYFPETVGSLCLSEAPDNPSPGAANPSSYGASTLYKGPGYPEEYAYFYIGDGTGDHLYSGRQPTFESGGIRCYADSTPLPNSSRRYVDCFENRSGWFLQVQEPAPDGSEAHTADLLRAALAEQGM